MGQFSWLYSNTGKQMIDGRRKDSYLLIPEKFQLSCGGKKWFLERCYDGYGHFEGADVYRLAPVWNQDFFPELLRRLNEGTWHCDPFCGTKEALSEIVSGRKELKDLDSETLRDIGIVMACYDEDNFALPYPIKITDRPMEYRDADASESDPDQGWETSSDEDPEEEILDLSDPGGRLP